MFKGQIGGFLLTAGLDLGEPCARAARDCRQTARKARAAGRQKRDAEGRWGTPVPGSARPVVNNPGEGALTKTFAALRTEAMQILLEPPAKRRRGPGEQRQSAPWIDGDGRSRPSCRSLDGIPIVRSRRQGTLGHGGGGKTGRPSNSRLANRTTRPYVCLPGGDIQYGSCGKSGIGKRNSH
jgi:hypothetical protein